MDFKRQNFYKANRDYVNDGLGFSYNYSIKQFKALNFSLFVAGMGFLATFVVALVTYYLLPPMLNRSYYGLVGFSFLIGAILAFVWNVRVHQASMAFGLGVISLYVINFGIMFGVFFKILNFGEILGAILLVSLIFIATFAVSKLLSFKMAFSLARFVFIASLVALGLVLIWVIASFILRLSRRDFAVYSIIISAVFGVLTVLNLVYNL